ncbi:helix-turn-helix domain-containing protein [Pseudonocardia acaciae]|uniref:helix-turn-helix domain-containing protein n=1 Tax=Pseudonocardia acaciae TaxID=551276 RepID=UPI0004914D0A|nr:helix-turn-helix transcriptional regulator [Pseudonocardia acaciae]
MVTSSSPAVLKRWIALELRRLRKEARLTQKDAANRIGRSQQHIGYLESARNLPSVGDLELLLGLYGTPERNDFMRELLTAARKGKNWWANLSDAVPDGFEFFLGLEVGAAELSSFDPLLVNGLLQTRSYAEAVIGGDTDITTEEIQRRAELRMGRQRILDRVEDPVRLWTVMDESVLHRKRGDSTVMREQLAHLLEMSERPRIDIQVLTLDAGAHTAQQGGYFTVMKFPPDMVGDPGVVYQEVISAGLFVENPEEIALYERALARVRSLAATTEESRRIIGRVMKEV